MGGIPVIPSKFPLGQLVATPGALEALQANQQDPLAFVRRHAVGAWGVRRVH